MSAASRVLRCVARVLVCGVTAGSVSGCAQPTEATPWSPPTGIEARQGEPGLGVRVWIVRDQSHAMARALHDAPEAPLPPTLRRTLRHSGLRVLAVPIEGIDELRAGLPVGGATQRQWLSRVPAWHPAIDGPRSGGPARVLLDTGPLVLDPGWARLMVRAWVEPVLIQSSGGAPAFAGRMRIELVPEHVIERAGSGLDRSLGGGASQDRFVFDRLAARWLAEPGMAYLVIAERPDADWAQLAALPDEPTTVARLVEDPAGGRPDPAGPDPMAVDGSRGGAGDERDDDAVRLASSGAGSSGVVPFPALGPRSPVTPTLGETILGSPAYAGSRAPIRAVLVLVPVAAERFELLPRRRGPEAKPSGR